MKTPKTFFFGIVCIASLFACDKTQWVTSEQVTIAWDAPEKMADGSAIPSNSVLRYRVYIDADTDNTHDDKETVTETPISETSFTLPSIEHKGKFFIGVQCLVYRVKNGEIYGEPMESDISWSSNKPSTEDGPFGIKIK